MPMAGGTLGCSIRICLSSLQNCHRTRLLEFRHSMPWAAIWACCAAGPASSQCVECSGYDPVAQRNGLEGMPSFMEKTALEMIASLSATSLRRR